MPPAEAWRTARQLWEETSEPLASIGALIGTTGPAVARRAQREKWGPRPGSRRYRKAPLDCRIPCPHCHERTATNPCGTCGKAA